MKNKKVCVIGMGYIGLPTSVMLSMNGYNVNGVDVNNDVISSVNKGESHIVEPGLEDQLTKVVKNGLLSASSSPEISDVYIICVPTPIGFDLNNKPSPDINYVINALHSIKSLLKDGDLLILESTSPVGTTELIASTLEKEAIDISNIAIAYCPERVLPGNIMHELIHNDRTVGGVNNFSTKRVSKFYKEFIKGEVVETKSKIAELCKLSENSFRDVNIAFANELSMFCDSKDIDVYELIELANRHPRVNILQPGIGVGGHCIAVDPWFIVASDAKNSRIIKTAREINLYKTDFIINKIREAINDPLNSKKTISIFGLAYKPDIDDLRESPAIKIVNELYQEYDNLNVVEPNIDNHPVFKLISAEKAIEDSELLIFLVKHKEFMESNFKEKLLNKTILDFCGIT